jgi:hypothetical protein
MRELKLTLGTWMHQSEAFDLMEPLDVLLPQRAGNWLGVEFGVSRHEDDYFLHTKGWNAYATVEDTTMLNACAAAEGVTPEAYLMGLLRTVVPSLPHVGTPVLRDAEERETRGWV